MEPVMNVRRRDRRGRGVRGPLMPQSTPAARTRAERFDDAALRVINRVESRWCDELRGTEFAVEDVPPSDPAPWESGVPLGRCFPADLGKPAQIVVYRRPIENRVVDSSELEPMLREVITEQVAHLLMRAPEDIDPEFYRD